MKGKRENGKIGKAKEEKIGIREMGNGEMQREVKPPPGQEFWLRLCLLLKLCCHATFVCL